MEAAGSTTSTLAQGQGSETAVLPQDIAATTSTVAHTF